MSNTVIHPLKEIHSRIKQLSSDLGGSERIDYIAQELETIIKEMTGETAANSSSAEEQRQRKAKEALLRIRDLVEGVSKRKSGEVEGAFAQRREEVLLAIARLASQENDPYTQEDFTPLAEQLRHLNFAELDLRKLAKTNKRLSKGGSHLLDDIEDLGKLVNQVRAGIENVRAQLLRIRDKEVELALEHIKGILDRLRFDIDNPGPYEYSNGLWFIRNILRGRLLVIPREEEGEEEKQ